MSTYSAVLTLSGFVLGFIIWKIKPDQKIDTFTFVLVISIFTIILFIFIKYSITLFEISNNTEIKVLRAIKPKGLYGNYKILLLVEANTNLPQDAVVTVFNIADKYEENIALGKVINIQDNGIIQILIFKENESFMWNDLLNNSQEKLNLLKIKPVLTVNYLQEAKNV